MCGISFGDKTQIMAFQDPERERAYQKAYHQDYREKTRERRRQRDRERYAANKDKYREKNRLYYASKQAKEGKPVQSYQTSLWNKRAQLFLDDWTAYFQRKGWSDESIHLKLEGIDKLTSKIRLYWTTREGSPI